MEIPVSKTIQTDFKYKKTKLTSTRQQAVAGKEMYRDAERQMFPGLGSKMRKNLIVRQTARWTG